jgi:hypothetical protein
LRISLRKHKALEAANKVIWYYPSLSGYTSLLEKNGFRVTFATHFDRATPLDGSNGIRNWIRMFGKPFFEGLDDATIENILADVEKQVKPTNFKNGQWFADYVRLRIMAIK